MGKPVKVKLGEGEYTLAPLNLGTQLKHKELLVSMTKSGFDPMENIDGVADLLTDAFRRSHPSMERELILQEVDMGNLKGVIDAMFAATGMEPVKGETVPGKVSPS